MRTRRFPRSSGGLALFAGAILMAPGVWAQATAGRSEVYETQCAVCHGVDGKSQTEEGRKKKARDLSNAKWQSTVADDRLVRSITKGREKMPAFGKKLTPEEIRALVKEVRVLAKAKAP